MRKRMKKFWKALRRNEQKIRNKIVNPRLEHVPYMPQAGV